LESLGEFLRAARTAKKISLEEISKKTRITLKNLEAFENDDEKNAPSHTFARGFLRSYAKYVGLNEEDVLSRYESSYSNKKEQKEEYRPEVIEGIPKKKSKAYIFYIIFVVALIWFAISIFSSKVNKEKSSTVAPQAVQENIRDPNESPVAEKETPAQKESEKKTKKKFPALESNPFIEDEEPDVVTNQGPDISNLIKLGKPKDAPIPAIKEEAKKPVTESAKVEPITPNIAPAVKEEPKKAEEKKAAPTVLPVGEKHKVVFRSEGVVWIHIQTDNNTPYEVTLKANEVYQIKATEKFNLKIGDAGKVKVELDGEKLGYLGQEKQVLVVTLPKPKQ